MNVDTTVFIQWQKVFDFFSNSVRIIKYLKHTKVPSGVFEGWREDLLEQTKRHLACLSHPRFEHLILQNTWVFLQTFQSNFLCRLTIVTLT